MTASAKPDRWGAFVDRDPSGASLASAVGPLAGLTVAVKDNIPVRGLKWTAGLPFLSNRIAREDAACVALLRAAGATIVGTVTTDAAGFGMMTPGVVNPLAPDRTAGGSSGGSAAAVAAGLADIALGTDTAGSVRVPAACCGLYGLKPTAGVISTSGLTPLSTTFDHVGLIGRELDALERTLNVLSPGSPPPVLPSRIGFDPERLGGTHPQLRQAVEHTLSWLASEGHEVVEISLPDPIELAEMHGAIVCAEALETWRDDAPYDRARFGETASRALGYAQTLDARATAAARSLLPRMRDRIDEAFRQVDAIAGPTIAVPVPPVGARRAIYHDMEVPVVLALLAETCPFNVSGHPALAVPLSWVSDGIPISLQIAARKGADRDAILLARELTRMPSHA